ncbi:hypothetical protein Sme01_45910 [Sphaerisporangium melleum]|uniref:RNA polymerase sigma-70 region 2 domain-containing protein n=1 Tax=Sphaerisporangium melleum TaxID=321316 RepID=A0A917QZ51_9ACTN|nr:sigma-70 family RNA polymerase sigma factor [Sphaerisporangium melleum]GGK79914.1 hypothetical protein GCM10007964_23170 [Sphaerisporangium melleum]GII72115.1 hypothetical protein Sme01_45910 [Sphaerisporangium melleum]
MNDSVLVEALRARDPGALAALYDTYAESLYGYALALLGSPDTAQVALRDTLIAAEAHIHALTDPGRLRVWLYALARGECVRRRTALQGTAGDEAEPVTEPAPAAGSGLRLVAASAVAALPEDEREVLDLLTRHDIPEDELAVVLGVTAAHAEELRQTAFARLQDLVTAEILARGVAPECAGRTDVLAGSSGGLDDETRELLLEHVDHCADCAPHRERQVSVAKVFDLLPVAEPPETLRVRVMSCFIDPELLPYRRFVARRAGLLDADGFPAGVPKRAQRAPAVLVGAVAALAIVVAGIVLVGAVRDAERPISGGEHIAPPSAGPPAAAVSGPPTPPAAGGTPSRAHPFPARPVAAVGPAARTFAPARPPAAPLPTVRPPRPSPSVPVPTPSSPASPAPRPTPPPPHSVPTHGGPPAVTPPPTVPQPPRPPRERPPVPAPTTEPQHGPRRTPCPSPTTQAPAATPAPSAADGAPSGRTAPPVPAPSAQAAGRVHPQ